MKESCLNCANYLICSTILEHEEDLTFEKVDKHCKFIGGFKERINEKNKCFCSFPTFDELYESVGKGLKKDKVKLDKDFWHLKSLEIIIMVELFDNKKSNLKITKKSKCKR